MRKRVVLALAFFLAAGTAWAKGHGNGHGRGLFAGAERHDRIFAQRDRDDRFWRDRDDWRDRDGWRNRDRHVSIFGRDDRPRGWSRGRKTGWGNCDLPPGLAKKEGCHGAIIRHHRRHGRDADFRFRDRGRWGR